MSRFWAGYLLGRGSGNDSIPPVPVVKVDVFLVLGTITALAAGYVEEEAESGGTTNLGETIA